MFSLKEYREPTDRLPDLLPWAALVAPGVVLQKEHNFQKTIAFRGPDLDSSSPSELVSVVARLNNALKRLGSGWAYFIEAQRHKTENYPEAAWAVPAAWLVDQERKEAFQSKGAHFESSYFITFVWQMPTSQTKKAEQFFYDNQAEAKDDHLENVRDLEFFQKSVREIVGIMSGVFSQVRELNDDETLTYMHSTISTHRHPIKTPRVPMYLDAMLPDQALTVGDILMLGDHFIPTLSIVNFPSSSIPGLLDDLNHLNLEYRWVTRFITLDKSSARKSIEGFRKRWWSKRKNLWTLIKEEASQQESALIDNDAANKAADCDAALQELGDDSVAYGYYSATITVAHTNLEQALQRLEKVKQTIQSRGFVAKDETWNAKEAWLGSLPGHVYANLRRPLLSTGNLAHFMPLSAIWAGNLENQHLKEKTGVGTPHLMCNTTGETPFRLNLNVGDVGHTLVVGPTGAGKSTLLALLEMQWLRYPDAQVVIFDKDRSARATTLAMGGRVYEPGNSKAPLAFQPLRRVHEEQERIWAAQFIVNLLGCQNFEVTPTIKKEIDQALVNMAADDELNNRTLTVFLALLQHNEACAALRPYTLEGNYGQLFDASQDDLDDVFWIMIEMGTLMGMGNEVIVPALDYLFHRVEQRFDGRPTLLVIDEAWLFLSHPVFAHRLRDWLKTLRKKNVYVVFATQEVSDAASSSICSTILSACHTKIYLPDEEAMTPDMFNAYRQFGLSEAEITLISRAQKKKDYYYRSVNGQRMFDLNLGEVALCFTGMNSQQDHRLLDDLVANEAPQNYASAILKAKGIHWAVAKLEQFKQHPQTQKSSDELLVERRA